MRKLRGKDVQITYGLADSLEQLEKESLGFRRQVSEFLDRASQPLCIDDGKLVVAHAPVMKEEMARARFGKGSRLCYVGETTGETTNSACPFVYNWAAGVSRQGNGWSMATRRFPARLAEPNN